MRLRIHRTDGKTGNYFQDDTRRATTLLQRLDARTLFHKGPIVIGVLNPFSILNPDEICWMEVETGLTPATRPTVHLPNLDRVHRLSGRKEYEEILARQWPLWRRKAQDNPGQFLEALVELAFRGGEEIYLHVVGRMAETSLSEAIFGKPAIIATAGPDVTLYINPKTITRARVYHSSDTVTYPSGILFAEADDI